MNTGADIGTDSKNRVLVFITEDRYRWHRHIILILFFAIVIYNGKSVVSEPLATIIKAAILMLLLSLFYLNMYLLVPKLLFKNRYTQYGLCIAGLIAVILIIKSAVMPLLRSHFATAYGNEIRELNLLGLGFIFLALIAGSTAIKLFQRWIYDTQRINELEFSTIQSELEQLKNQINPHFLFNMLNNVNVLTQKDPEKASQVIMKLSDLLRYQLYDSARDRVLLTADIHFLTDLLNLEKIRRDNFEFFISQEGDLSGVQVPPLLFITFIENAVKHTMDVEMQSFVNVYFRVYYNRLFFKCSNSKPQLTITKNGTGGLGLLNVKRRLELLYPGKHTLQIKDGDQSYSINLTIEL